GALGVFEGGFDDPQAAAAKARRTAFATFVTVRISKLPPERGPDPSTPPSPSAPLPSPTPFALPRAPAPSLTRSPRVHLAPAHALAPRSRTPRPSPILASVFRIRTRRSHPAARLPESE